MNGNWEIEEALDIEWAHAIAPGASIVLVEASSESNADLFAAIKTAASLPGVSAVSMSWGLNEFSGETALDSTFVTPAGHQGVTFVAASGDSGGFAPDAQGDPTTTPGILYPAASPRVVGVGGTTLNLNSDSTYNSETAWSLSGGGTSLFEARPAFQQGAQSTAFRTVPDVAFDADPNTGRGRLRLVQQYRQQRTLGRGRWYEPGGAGLGRTDRDRQSGAGPRRGKDPGRAQPDPPSTLCHLADALQRHHERQATAYSALDLATTK